MDHNSWLRVLQYFLWEEIGKQGEKKGETRGEKEGEKDTSRTSLRNRRLDSSGFLCIGERWRKEGKVEAMKERRESDMGAGWNVQVILFSSTSDRRREREKERGREYGKKILWRKREER